MNYPLTQSTAPRSEMGIYQPFRQTGIWEDAVKGAGGSTIIQEDVMLDHKPSFISHASMDDSRNDEASIPDEKLKKRLAQNREAARKSRLRKKAYVKQLESSRLKLAQMEQNLKRTRHHGVYIESTLDTVPIGMHGTANSGCGSTNSAFEMEYSHWIDEQNKYNCQLRDAMQTHITPTELHNLVDTVLNHYYSVFRMKADAAKADVVYLMSGLWMTSAERLFLWIGGFRPSDLLNVLMPHFDPLTDQQQVEVGNLRQSSQQAEDALSQGIDKLQQNLAQMIAADPIVNGSYGSQVEDAMENLETMESFINQADHLREQTLQQMSRILTTRQAARGLLGLGEYFHRLRALSSLCASRLSEAS